VRRTSWSGNFAVTTDGARECGSAGRIPDIAEETALVDAQLAALNADRAREFELRDRRAELAELERLEQEKAQLAREKRAALAKLKTAEAADREAKAAPLVTALDATTGKLADLERETALRLWSFVRETRTQHERHAALVTQHNATLAELRAVDPEAARVQLVQHPQSLRAYVTTRWQRFNCEGGAQRGARL
jgi:hypothetical protein